MCRSGLYKMGGLAHCGGDESFELGERWSLTTTRRRWTLLVGDGSGRTTQGGEVPSVGGSVVRQALDAGGDASTLLLRGVLLRFNTSR